ncbi:MAG: hypothetical protein M1133_12045 [Armatimonadetes bacterium]|nr:hypothetical protein [Armatimonadota bacterium]
MVETTDAVILAIVFCGLGFGVFAAETAWQVVLTLAALAGAAYYTIYSFRLGGLKSFYKARCAEYMLAIQQDPTNRAARQFLAETLYMMGELDRAVEEMQVAVDMGADLEAQYKLSKWGKERYMRDCPNPICRWCHTENEQAARTCVKCGADLPYRNSFNQWIAGGRTATARYYLILTAGASVLVVSLILLPIQYALVPTFLLLVAMAGWSLVSSARS